MEGGLALRWFHSPRASEVSVPVYARFFDFSPLVTITLVKDMMDASGESKVKDKTKEAFVEKNSPEIPEAFTQFVCKHQRAVFGVAYAKLRNVHDAQDVAQDVFMEAYRKMNKLNSHDKTVPWLFKMTAFRCNDHIRKSSRRQKREMVFANTVSASTLPDSQSDRGQRAAVLEAISRLPEKFRVIVMLKHFAELSYADISKMTGLSKTTIDGRLRTAKKRLKEKLMKEVLRS